MQQRRPNTQDEARQHAIDWQNWQAIKELSQGEMNNWQIHFEDIANEWGLYDEFKENGII